MINEMDFESVIGENIRVGDILAIDMTSVRERNICVVYGVDAWNLYVEFFDNETGLMLNGGLRKDSRTYWKLKEN